MVCTGCPPAEEEDEVPSSSSCEAAAAAEVETSTCSFFTMVASVPLRSSRILQ